MGEKDKPVKSLLRVRASKELGVDIQEDLKTEDPETENSEQALAGLTQPIKLAMPESDASPLPATKNPRP